MVSINGLTKIYTGHRVVDDLSFNVNEGEVFALLGSNGAGKSTTIKMILGLVKKDGGSIGIKKDIRVGYSPETPYFPPYLTGLEVLDYYAAISGTGCFCQETDWKEARKTGGSKKAARLDAAIKLLEQVGLEDSSTKVRFYSKGMLQRLALAQALLNDPELLVLDEPCAGLDAMGRIEMLEMIRALKNRGKTVILNSHILSDIEKVCERGIIMGKGRKLKDWSQSDLKDGTTLESIFVRTVGGNA